MKSSRNNMKRIVVFLFLLICLAGVVHHSTNKVIGTVSGLENERITINDVVYERDLFTDFSRKDRGSYLGKVENNRITMRVYSVKGDNEGDYIYALWEWEGSFYRKEVL